MLQTIFVQIILRKPRYALGIMLKTQRFNNVTLRKTVYEEEKGKRRAWLLAILLVLSTCKNAEQPDWDDYYRKNNTPEKLCCPLGDPVQKNLY